MLNKVHYKIATKDEVIKLSNLFLCVFRKNFSKEELIWRYLNNPIHKSKILNCIAIDEKNEIVGHTAFIKRVFKKDNTKLYGALTVGTAVRKEFSGIFPPMYKYLEDSFKNEFDFIYGYPNLNSYPFFTKLFNFKLMNSRIYQIKSNGKHIYDINKFRKIINIIKSQCYENNLSFLKWRISQNPINKYFYFCFNNSIIIWKKYKNMEYDIIGVFPESTELDLEERIIDENNCLFNIFYAADFKSALFTEIYSTPRTILNNFVIKKVNNVFPKNMFCFQMIDLDVF